MSYWSGWVFDVLSAYGYHVVNVNHNVFESLFAQNFNPLFYTEEL